MLCVPVTITDASEREKVLTASVSARYYNIYPRETLLSEPESSEPELELSHSALQLRLRQNDEAPCGSGSETQETSFDRSL
jgi:hypothetical protein